MTLSFFKINTRSCFGSFRQNLRNENFLNQKQKKSIFSNYGSSRQNLKKENFLNQTQIKRCYTMLSDREYKLFRLLSKKPVNYNSSIYTFELPNQKLNIPLGKHLCVRALIDGKYVVRPYTPISPQDTENTVDFLIKVYKDGPMSSYINTLKPGDSLEIMGPIGTITYTPKKNKEVGLIAGGTGITPIYQIIQNVLNNPEDNTLLTLLYANNSEKDILLKEELETLEKKNKNKLKIHHVLMNAPEGKGYNLGQVSKELIKKYLNTNSLIMVCGPPKMEDVQMDNLSSLGVKEVVAFTQKKVNFTNQNKENLEIKEFTKDEVALHDKQGDCWLTINKKVYDVTNFVDEHPGGYIILDGAGKDATELFVNEFPHSDDAYKELDNFFIGNLKEE